MAIYRNISLTFWEDSKVVDSFTPKDKYFYLYLLTNPHTNLLGCYQISLKQIISETGYSKMVVINLINRMVEIHKVIEFDFETNEIFIKNWSKYNWTSSPKLQKPLEACLKDVKSENFKEKIEEKMKNREKKDTVSLGYDYPSDTTVSVTVSDTVNNNIKKFIKPTLEEVKKYCRERKNKIDAEKFIDYYESNGWKIGKNSMKDWKATIRTWEKNEKTVDNNGVIYETV